MAIEIDPPIAFSEKGRRAQNEDSIFPPIRSGVSLVGHRFFLVCDGVGGEAKGEEASRLCCTTISHRMDQLEQIGETDLQEAVSDTERAIDAYTATHPEAGGMATTLTFLALNHHSVLLGHVGDSRIYQFRQGRILFKTQDHSLVNDLLKNGLLTREQAVDYPHKNVLTKAIIGSQRPATAQVQVLQDIRPDDHFLLCSDGVLECFSDQQLEDVFGNPRSNLAEKAVLLQTRCRLHAHDNFSAYLIRIRETGD